MTAEKHSAELSKKNQHSDGKEPLHEKTQKQKAFRPEIDIWRTGSQNIGCSCTYIPLYSSVEIIYNILKFFAVYCNTMALLNPFTCTTLLQKTLGCQTAGKE